MTATAKLVLSGPAADAAAIFNKAAEAFRDKGLQPQVTLGNDGSMIFSFGDNTTLGTIKNGKLITGEAVRIPARTLGDGFNMLAKHVAGLPGEVYLVTTAPTQEYDVMHHLYRFQDGQMQLAATFINDLKLD